MYGAEAWTMTKSDEAALGAFEKKILRRIFGDGDEIRMRMNHELYELYADIDIVRRVKIQRLRWLGHIARMDDNAPAKKTFASNPSGGRRRRGRPYLRWGDQTSDDLTSAEISHWR